MGLAFDIFFTRPVGATGKNARISAVKSSRDVIHCAAECKKLRQVSRSGQSVGGGGGAVGITTVK